MREDIRANIQDGASDGARHALHELCQPLTRLQWRLEVGHRLGDEATLREAIEGGLKDLLELSGLLHELRKHMMNGGAECSNEVMQ